MKAFSLILTALLALSVLTACGPAEKSRELKELETILQDPNAKDVRDAPGASKPYREARQFRNLALEAWQDGKDDVSIEYAILGTLRYRTAAAIKEQTEAKTRLDAANTNIETNNPEVMALTQERNKLNQQVAQLERQVNLARQKGGGGFGTDTELKNAIMAKMQDVDAAQKQADLVEAKTHAPTEYNKAENLEKSVRLMLGNNEASQQMLTDATEAHRLFLEAQKKAEPKYQVAVSKANPEERRSKLRAEASGVYGGGNVVTERLGARIVMPALFKPGESSVNPSMKVMVDELVKLAKTYDEFDIYVEGFTSKTGSATENLGLSQLRANAVRDALTSNGIKSSRIETRGYGQDRLRFDAKSEQNERVEVVMSRSN